MSTIEKDVLSAPELEDLVREKEHELSRLRARLAEWERTYEATPKRDVLFSTVSGRCPITNVRPLATPCEVQTW